MANYQFENKLKTQFYLQQTLSEYKPVLTSFVVNLGVQLKS